MTVKECAAIAADWLRENEARRPGYIGAYVGGSTAAMDPESTITGGSDMDIYVVSECPPPEKIGKFTFRNALLEVSYIEKSAVFPAEKALKDYHLANSLRHEFVLGDPTGELTALTRKIAAAFSLPENIAARRDHALSRVQSGLTNINHAAPLPDLTLSWLFPTGITTHAVLVSAMKNPTVRLRYVRAREVLIAHNMEDVHETLLTLSGFGEITPDTALAHLQSLIPVYNFAAANCTTPFFFKSDVSPQSRPAAIDATENLIQIGLHRESMFWIITTWARCMKMLQADFSEICQKHLPEFQSLLQSVNRSDTPSIDTAAQNVIAYLPTLKTITDKIISPVQ